MTDKEKIMQYLDFKGVSKNKFYRKTGLSVGFLDSGSSLGVDKLKIIIDNYPDLNLFYILGEEENMIVENKIKLSNKNTGTISGNNIIGNKIKSNEVHISISNTDISKLIDSHKDLVETLKVSQNQVNILLEMLKNK